MKLNLLLCHVGDHAWYEHTSPVPTYLCGDEASKQEITKISFCSSNDLTGELHLI